MDKVLLPLHQPDEMEEWRDQIPAVQVKSYSLLLLFLWVYILIWCLPELSFIADKVHARHYTEVAGAGTLGFSSCKNVQESTNLLAE